MSLFLPQILLERIINYCTERIKHSYKILVAILHSIINLLKVIKEYKFACRQLIINYPKALFNTFVVTVLFYFNRFLLAYCLVNALGGMISFNSIVTTQSLILFLPYFAPTPGGSGFSEISINGLMSDTLSGGILLSFTYLYRFLLYYIYVIIGGISIMKELKFRISENGENLPLPIAEYSAE